MADGQQRRTNQGRVKSCTQCRQHKLRCNARQHPGRPCARCLKMGLDCVVTKSWERYRPQTKAQLALENEELRKQLHRPTEASSHLETSATPQQALASMRNEQGDHQLQCELNVQHHLSPSQSPFATDPTLVTPYNADFSMTSTDELDGLPMLSTKACFKLFFDHYAPFLPGIFDSDTSLTDCHRRSPFLFWAMVCTGARHFQDSAFSQKVGSKVREIAASALFQIQDPTPTIQAALILCLWPLPIDTHWKDPSHALAGAAMQLAVQNGLHTFRHEQDFRRVQIDSNDRARMFRISLWLHCIMIFQTTSICDGLPFTSLRDSWAAGTEAALELIEDESLVHRYKLHRLQTLAIAAITQNNDLLDSSACRGISTIINAFDSQVREVGSISKSPITDPATKCARLSLLVYHFFAPADDARTPGLLCLFTVCTDMLDLATKLDATQSFAWYSTNYYSRMVMLAAFCVLRIMRSKLQQFINPNDAEQTLFKAINFVRNRSCQPFDLDARYGVILKQLYSSTIAFRREDGEIDGLHLDIRSRLVGNPASLTVMHLLTGTQFMSIAFDSFWWWRAEFDGRANPYRSPTATTTTNPRSAAMVLPEMDMLTDNGPPMSFDNDLGYDQSTMFGEFPDWNWPAGLTLEGDVLSLPHLP